ATMINAIMVFHSARKCRMPSLHHGFHLDGMTLWQARRQDKFACHPARSCGFGGLPGLPGMHGQARIC
ncbi:hypothetical protein LRN56_16790, partial [Staphylococcus aureus]|nr:hypothetical protein [Staphylococcus aureus]